MTDNYEKLILTGYASDEEKTYPRKQTHSDVMTPYFNARNSLISVKVKLDNLKENELCLDQHIICVSIDSKNLHSGPCYGDLGSSLVNLRENDNDQTGFSISAYLVGLINYIEGN